MRVRIRGKVVLKKDGKVVAEVPNTILLANLTSILAQVFQGSPPSGSDSPSISIVTGSGVIQVPVTYKDFVWAGSFTVDFPVTLLEFDLNATFNGYPFPASVIPTLLTIPQGTYTVEWVWVVDDPVGLVRDILNYGFAGVYKGFSVKAGTCTSLLGVDVFQNFITLVFACFESSTTTYTSFGIAFAITNTSNTTVTVTTSIPFFSNFQLVAPNTLVVPFTIELV